MYRLARWLDAWTSKPPPTSRLVPRTCGAVVLALVAAALTPSAAIADDAAPGSPPPRLRDTGLYLAGSTIEVAPANLAFAPQYPLWSDGTTKRRWLHVPPGRHVDASRPDAWVFPPGTRAWKEFAYGGRRIETRYIERREDGSWLFATYLWNDEGSDAVLAPERGVKALAVAQAPSGRYPIPSRADCLACHEGAAAPLLGVGALQLSPDRDPLASHARADGGVDLPGLVARGWLQGLPGALLATPPRIAAATPTERAALGYLHGNCGHCHNDSGSPAPVRLVLAQRVTPPSTTQRAAAALFGAPTRYRMPTAAGAAHTLIEPGRPDASVLVLRMRSRDPWTQMPPLGSQMPDADGLALIERWITDEPSPSKETRP
jgi:hypothetical protein